MSVRISLFLIFIVWLPLVASDQCTFSDDTVVFGALYPYNEGYSIRNNTDQEISIETICYTRKIAGEKQTEPTGMMFDKVMYFASDAEEGPDTLFCREGIRSFLRGLHRH